MEAVDPVEQKAEEILAGMSLEEKVGQLFIARCPETEAASRVTQYHLGGYILFARDFTGKTKEEVTASISLPIHNILRNEFGFDGVIITDDLVMEGVRQFAGDAEIAVRAVQAGNDMLCCTDFEVQVPAVVKAVENGEITEERLNESVLRILKMKIKLGIIADTADAQD